MNITTKKQYAAFKASLQKDDVPSYSKVSVGPLACRNVLGEVKELEHRETIAEIDFADKKGNFVRIRPPERMVVAKFKQEHCFSTLPVDYATYVIDVHDASVKVSNSDIRVIFTWTQAENLTVSDLDSVATRIGKQAKQLKQLPDLKAITLDYPENGFGDLRASHYFGNLKQVKTVTFGNPDRYEDAKLKAIQANQMALYDAVIEGNAVVCKRKPKLEKSHKLKKHRKNRPIDYDDD